MSDTPEVMRFDAVHAAYGPFKALFGVSFTVREGRAIALVGPNGAGKTTVARVASGLVRPTAGVVSLDGRDISRRRASDLARLGVAHAPEGRSVFASLTVEENLVLSFRRSKSRSGAREAVQRAVELFPRLGERRTQLAGTLSGGEQRMLTLARVLVLEPRILIADELSLGLAPIITSEVYRVLEQIRSNGTALLVVEQHLDHALGIADEVVMLERGNVVFSGTPDEMAQRTTSGVS